MPATSKAQQRLFGMALAYKRGELDDASEEVKKLADSMTEKQLRDFAKTDTKDLPEKANESFNKTYERVMNESPDSIWSTSVEPIAFIIMKDDKELFAKMMVYIEDYYSMDGRQKYLGVSDLTEIAGRLKEIFKKHKIKGRDLVLWHDNDGRLWINKHNTNIVGENRFLTHFQLVSYIFSEFGESRLDKLKIMDHVTPNARAWGITSGRYAQRRRPPLCSFWTHTERPDEYMKILLSNTKIKFAPELEVEVAPKGVTSRAYSEGPVSKFSTKKNSKPEKKVIVRDVDAVDPIDAVRNRRWPGLKFEDILSEADAKGSMKKTVKLEFENRGPDKNKFSGWFVPEDTTLILFPYAYHGAFMRRFWPSRDWFGDKDTPYIIQRSDKNIDKYVKKYAKKIEKTLRKLKLYEANYSDFYELGWIRINFQNNAITISHNGKYSNQSDVQHLLRWVKYTYSDKEVKIIRIEDVSKGAQGVTNLTWDKIQDMGVAPMSTDEKLDAVRNRMFGPNQYEEKEIVSFKTIVENILAVTVI